MKTKGCAGLILSLALLLPTAPSALADATPTPSPTVRALSELEQYKVAIEQYKDSMEQYRTQMNIREQMRREINKLFVSTIKKAEMIEKNAMRRAQNDGVRSTVRNQRESAVEQAILDRDSAIVAMGFEPVEPTKPVKPIAAAATKKAKPEKPSPTPSS